MTLTWWHLKDFALFHQKIRIYYNRKQNYLSTLKVMRENLQILSDEKLTLALESEKR